MSTPNHPNQSPSMFERLEDRVLFDGVPDATFILPQTDGVEVQPAQIANIQHADSATHRELVIVDAGVENSDQLLQSFLSTNSESRFEIRYLDSNTDGVQQITTLLSQAETQFDAIHVLSHGEAGSIELGSSSLSYDNVNHYIDELASWSNALTEDADLLFYGCELASNASGQSLIETISSVTGADVAASTDLTGNAKENADWKLEFVSGKVETLTLSSANWRGTLAIEATDGVVTVQDAEFSGAGVVSLTNNGSPEVVTTVGTPLRVGQMLERVWTFNETADTGRATYVFDVSSVAGFNGTIAAEFGLIISDQPDLSGANTTTLVASGYDSVNELVYFHQVDLNDGEFFGLATEVVQDNFTVNPTAIGDEDTAIDLGLVLYPALTDGGKLRDIIGVDTGYRDSSAGSTPTEFYIPAGSTGIKITGYSTNDIGTSASDTGNDDYQRMIVSIDLDSELSNGFMSHLIDQGPSRSDQFGWSDAPLGSSILSGGGTITGDADDNINPIFTIVDGVLQITENHRMQTAYHVEFLTNATSSADFIQTATGVSENGSQADVSLAVPGTADYAIINIADAETSSDSRVEYKGNSRIYVDLNTLRASGVVAAQRGETDNRVVSYAFEDYDVSSAAVGSILSGAGSVVGDSQQNAGVLNDNQIYIDASGNLVINRENTFAGNFDTMITVEYYDRKDVGSSAAQLGESTAYGLWNADPSDPLSILEFDIPDNASLGILNLTMNGTRTNDTNENMGAGFAVIDLSSGTSSGSIYMIRTGGTTDLVGWDQTDFGTVFFDDPNTISNHTTINQFVDKFAGNAVFNLTNSGTTLELETHSPQGTQSFLDYFVAGQIEWYGNAPLEISGFPADGTFDKGTFNPVTGNWDITLAEAQAGLAYVPPEHFSGTSPVQVNLIIGDEIETTTVTVQAVIDPIMFDSAPDACGDEDTDISISDNVTPTFVDQDGSETLTSIMLSAVPVGHTISDGTNSFTASAGSQSVDITAWDRANLTYRANAEESGTFTITLDADWQDVGGGVTDTDTISTTFDVVVKPVNDPPVAVDDFYTVLGNTTLNVPLATGLLNNDSDAEGDTLNATLLSGPSNGTVTVNADGTFTYNPTAGFSGTDSFEYQVSDGNNGFATATAYIDVSEPVTGPLDAMDDMVTTNEETLINIDVMNNDDLPTTGAFNIQSTTPPSNGTITVLPNGTINYTPATDFFGVDTFTYTLADASGRTSTATVTVTVDNTQDPPVANADSGSTPEDTTLPNIDILGNDSDPDNDPLTVTMATAANGTVVINGDGTIDYTPDPGFFGTDTVNYTITDGNSGFASSTVLINVAPVADPPTSTDSSVTVIEDGSYAFVAGDFSFADEDPGDSFVAVRIDSLPVDGQLLFQGAPVTFNQVVSLTDINAGKLTFVPDPDDFGNNYTTFGFSVSDGVLFQATPNTMTVHVTPEQDPPVATDNSITVNEGSTGNPLGLASPTDLDGDSLTATVTGLPAFGNVFLADGFTVVSNGDMLTMAQLTALVYNAPADYAGADPGDFTYDVTDGMVTDSGVVDFMIVAVNDPPEICLGEHVSMNLSFIDDRIGFNAALVGDSSSTIIDDGGAFSADAATGTFASVVRNGMIGGAAYGYTIYDIDFSNSPNGMITPGVVGNDIFDLDNIQVEAPASQGSAVGSGSWGVDTNSGSTSTRNALLFDFTTTPGGVGIGHFGAEFHDLENDAAFTSAEYRIYKAGVLIDSGILDWGAGNNGNNESHFFGYTVSSPADFFDQVVIVSGDDGAGGGLAERMAADRMTFGGAFSEASCEDYADTFTEGGDPVSFVDPAVSLTDVDDTTFPELKIDVDESTVVDAGEEFLTIGGVDFQLDAAANSTTAVFVGGTSYNVSFDAATARMDIVRTDSAEMTAAEIEAILLDTTYRNDSVLPTVGDRVFDVCVNDGDDDSNIATTTITVVRDVETAQWSITGSATVIDGNDATYVVELSDPLRDGETASVDLGLMAIDTNSSDYGTLNAAVTAAVAAYAGPGSLAWDGTTLTFTSDGTGAMAPLSIALPTIPDGVYEGDEDYKINLSNPASTTGETITIDVAADEVTTTIIDDTPAPTISIGDGSATEGAPVEFVISLDVPSFEPITLDLAAATGSATAGTDFEVTNFEYFDGTNWVAAAAGTQVTIPGGQTSLMVRVDSVQDSDVEPDETFTLSATVVSGTVTNASDTGTGAIVNDDNSLISIDDVAVDEDNGTMTFTISLDQPPTGTVTVDWATASGSATSGVDFTAAMGTATFTPGVQTQTVTIAITDDNLYEGAHTFDVDLSNASGGTILDGMGVGTIIDDGSGPNGTDDDRPIISIDDVVATEDTDTHAVFTISLSNPSVEDVELSLALLDVTATSGADYGSGLEYFDGASWQPVAGNVTIVAGATSLQVRTPIIDDPFIDDNETYSLVVTHVSGTTANSGDTGTGTILDDPTPDATLVSITGDPSVTEGSVANYNIALTNTPLTDVTITFTYTGTASGGTDYTGVASVTIPAGSTMGVFSIPTIDDTLGEPLESFTVAIDNVTGGSLEALLIDPTDFEATTEIIDDDVPAIAVNDVIVTEGVEFFGEFTVELSNPTWEAIDFSITAVGVDAQGDETDFGILGLDELEVFDGTNWVPATAASFAPGETTILMRTPIFDDSFGEGDETFTVTVTTTGGTTSNPSDSGTGTIQDDTTDPETVLVSLSGPGSVVEGATTTSYTLDLTDPGGLPINAAEVVTITLTYTGTAADGSDYTGVATVVIPINSSSGTFTLPTVDDSLYEGTETIIITIDSVTGGGFEGIAVDPAADTVTTTIDDTADIPTVAINDVTSVEGTDSFAVYTIELSNLSIEDIDVSLSLANGSAAGLGVDFGAAGAGNLQVFDGTNWVDATTATIAAGDYFVQVRVPVVDDLVDEPTENYTLTVDVTAGTTTNIQIIGTGGIVDDDPAPDVTIDDATATEGDPLVFNVTLSNPSSQPIVLDFAASDTSTTAATDYNATAFEYSTNGGSTWVAAVNGSEVTIPANSSGVLVRVLTTEDLTLETTETMELSIASVVSGLVGNTTDTAVGTITDDDSALVSITANDPVAGEPVNHGQFTVSMTNPSDTPTVISYFVTGSASSGIDYAALSGTITIPAGVTSDTIDLTVIDDSIIEGLEDVTITLTAITSGDTDISIDALNDSDTVTISDDDTATWQLTGDTTVNEGADATYNLALIGTLQSGESTSVNLAITDNTTTSTDYDSFDTAVADAVAAYGGPGSLAWDGAALTFTSDGTGEMAPLVIDLMAVNDAIVEGVEEYNVSISGAVSATGIAVTVDAVNNSVDTEIQDTIDAVGTSLDKASWSIVGAPSVNEAATTDYTITIDATLQDLEVAEVDLSLAHVDTTIGDLTALNAAVTAAVATYNGSGQPGSLVWDGTTLSFTSDGIGPMGDLIVQIVATADGFLEGPEDYKISLTNPNSTTGACVGLDMNDSVTTTIAPDATTAQWSIGVDNGDDEGASVQYTVSLTESLGVGDSAAVELTLNDVDTNSGDYDDFVAAVNAAIAAYTGPGSLAFDGTTLTFTAVADGDAMADLEIDLGLNDDVIVEGVETFTVDLSSPSGPTGVNVSVSPTANSVTTTINDTVGVGGGPDAATWSIVGPASGDEGTNAQYTVSLDGALGVGETASVVLNLTDVDTTSSDYASIIAAATAAAASNSDVMFDTGTGTFTYTAPTDGAAMTDLVIDLGLNTDALVEGPEDFQLGLSTPSSSTGAAVEIDPTADLVTTTIIDLTDPLEWAIDGPVASDEGSAAQYTITLDGALGEDEAASVVISLSDLTTNPNDYDDIHAAIALAIGGNPNLAYDMGSGTLIFTSPSDGATMPPIVFDLGIVNDAFVEGSEQFSIALNSPGSTTGAATTVSASDGDVTTEIYDTQDAGLDPDQAEWSIVGDATVAEGATADYTVSLAGQFGANQVATVNLGLANVDTTSSDYLGFVAAVNVAVSGYMGPGTVAFDGTTITFTAANDGDAMSDLVFGLEAFDDLLVEGDEDYAVSISSAASSTGGTVLLSESTSVTTTITDDDRATWSFAGDTTVGEGASAEYTVALAGTLQAGETVTIDLGLAEVDTTSTDYLNFVAAVNAAVIGRSDLAFDGTTLTYTGDGSPMTDVIIDLTAFDDLLIESDEDYTVSISNPGSTTGSDIAVGGTTTVTTTITDNDTATWSITGDATVGEGATAEYTVALAGTLQAGETATINLGLADVDTTSTDYLNFVAAVNAAIVGRSDLAFDGTTLTYTGDGNAMTDVIIDLTAFDDLLIESDEGYTISVSNPGSTTGSDIAVGGSTTVTTTIADNDTATWSVTGDATVGEGATAEYTVTLAGTLQANETATIDLGLADVDTTSTDYLNFVAAVNAAIAGRSDLAFDGTTLTYTGDGNPMTDVVIDLTAFDDLLIESDENYTVSISNPGSTTDSDIAAGGSTVVTTTITDNDTATWGITGDATVGEGSPAEYTVALAGTLQAGETATVDLGIADVDTTSTDYLNFVAAVNAAIAGRSDLAFDGTTLTYTGDGNPMSDVVIDLTAFDDSLIEGDEDYAVTIANAASTTGSEVAIGGTTSVTTTITDNDTATWSITGDPTVDEGNTSQYTVALDGAFQAGGGATIDLGLSNVDTTSTDYADFAAAVNAAIASYAGPGAITFDGTALTFAATNDGDMMADLVIAIETDDDLLGEGSEVFSVTISNPRSSSGSYVATDPITTVDTIIIDNDKVAWSIVGDNQVDEGGTAQYTIALEGILQAGEDSMVQVDLSDLETNSADYVSFIAAIQAAAATRPDLSFDAASGLLTVTGSGTAMPDLVFELDAFDDAFVEGPERYQILLSNATSTTGLASEIDPANSLVTTTINDTIGDGGAIEEAVWTLGVDQTVPEGIPGAYVLELSGNLQAGEIVSVDLALTDIDTMGSDYASFNAAMTTAASAYSGPGSVAWNGTTFTFTSDGTGPMATVSISVDTTNDSISEGTEDFLISLSNANSLTGAATSIDATADDAVTTIDDATGSGSDDVTFAITGDTTVDEGGTATYTVTTTGGLGAGQNATVDLAIGNGNTNVADYANFDAAVIAAVNDYNLGSNPGSVSWDGTTLTYTAAVDGDTLTGLVIDLNATDDTFLEGPETYDVTLTNAGSSSGISSGIDPSLNNVFTTIEDTVGDGGVPEPGAEWSLTGGGVVDEGDDVTYTVGLTGNLQAGEATTIQISVGDIETTSGDYQLLSSAVTNAVNDYNANPANSGSLVWDGTFLTFTSDGSGAMNDLDFTHSTVDDVLVEGPERFNVLLANPSSSTGLSPTMSSTENLVTTTIVDNDLPEWSISGPVMTSEGGIAVFTVELDGVFQAGETVSVSIDLSNVDTNSSDYGDLIAAIVAAATANPDVNFDPATGMITYTAPSNGAAMADLVIALPITSDGISEGPEDFAISLFNPASSSGLAPTIDPAMATVNTTINGSPVLQPDSEFTNIDTPLIGNVLSNDSDPDGDVLEVTHVDGNPIGVPIVTDCGIVEMNPNGTYTFTPNPGFFGVDTFTYTVVDSAGNVETSTVEIIVNHADLGVAKAASDAVPNGENWDITFTLVMANLGNVALDNLTLTDDLMSLFGGAFVSSTTPTVQNFVGTGSAPTINGTWSGDTSQNILAGGTLEVGASFEVVFVVTIDPDAGGVSQALENQAVASGQGINPDGTRMLNSNGDPAIAWDDSDNGLDPDGENGNDNSDGVYGNDPTPIVIADLGIAKAILGEPTLLFSGNYIVTYQVFIENTGTVDLANISLLEDLASQFGGAFVDAGDLTLSMLPTNPTSSIAVDSAGFNGRNNIEIMDGANANVLAVGDSFAVTFNVEIDPVAASGSLGNQVTGSGTAVDESGNPINDSSGNPITGSDLSDSGSDPGSSNSSDPNDSGTSSDVSVFTPPALPLGEISGTVFLDENNNGIRDAGEGGIEGVEINLLGTDVYGNAVDITVFTDSNGGYAFTNLNAGNYRLREIQPSGFSDGQDNGNSSWTTGNDEFSDIVLNWGQTFASSTFAERSTSASGNPSGLTGGQQQQQPFLNSRAGRLISDYVTGPGPIYSGVPMGTDSNPLSFDRLDSGRPFLGGYSSDGMGAEEDCGCEFEPNGQPLIWTEAPQEEVIECDNIVGEAAEPNEILGSSVTEVSGPDIELGTKSQSVDSDEVTESDSITYQVTENQVRSPFLKRFANWLHR